MSQSASPSVRDDDRDTPNDNLPSRAVMIGL